MEVLALKCYCCGEAIGRQVALVSMGTSVDRVFVAKPEHIENFDDSVKSETAIRD